MLPYRVTRKGLRALLQQSAVLLNLEVLDLCNNNIGDRGAADLVTALPVRHVTHTALCRAVATMHRDVPCSVTTVPSSWGAVSFLHVFFLETGVAAVPWPGEHRTVRQQRCRCLHRCALEPTAAHSRAAAKPVWSPVQQSHQRVSSR